MTNEDILVPIKFIEQAIHDTKQICKSCLSSQMECEAKILNEECRCCPNCWHIFIDSTELEDRIFKIKKAFSKEKK